MGYVDYELLLGNAQAVTASTQTTNYIDAVQAGWAADDELYAKFFITTAYGGTAGSSVTLSIQIAQDTAFGTATEIVSYKCMASVLAAKAVPLVVKLPVGMMVYQLGKSGGDLYQANVLPYRYIRGYYTLAVASTTFSATCTLMKDINTTIDRVL
jgi:hypothetical protein